MARVNEGSRSFSDFICHPHVYPQVRRMNHTCLYSPAAEHQWTLAHSLLVHAKRLTLP